MIKKYINPPILINQRILSKNSSCGVYMGLILGTRILTNTINGFIIFKNKKYAESVRIQAF